MLFVALFSLSAQSRIPFRNLQTPTFTMASQDIPHPLPAGLSPDSIDVPSELATILTRIHYTHQQAQAAAADTKPPAIPSNDLAPKDLPTATDSLKHKIQHARAAAHTLPDVHRAIAAQNAEIAELHTRLAEQRAALAKLKEFGLLCFTATSDEANTDGDFEMGGMRGADGGGVASQSAVAPST